MYGGQAEKNKNMKPKETETLEEIRSLMVPMRWEGREVKGEVNVTVQENFT